VQKVLAAWRTRRVGRGDVQVLAAQAGRGLDRLDADQAQSRGRAADPGRGDVDRSQLLTEQELLAPPEDAREVAE
jgi:hypothetical protein